MKKLLSSPLTKRKASSHSKVFGTALEVLVQRETQQHLLVPFIVTRICQYIEKHGMMQEGLFRISGNAKLIEKLKSSFDQTGDAVLETDGDVASAAALLKLFLRELPDPVIPLSMHNLFLEATRANIHDRDECVHHLQYLVSNLPEENIATLKYLIHFLEFVTQFQDQNRMSASSLGIVFGPNLFRVTDDFSGLKDQAITNQIVTTFINNYSYIFEEKGTIVKRGQKIPVRICGKSVTEPLTVMIPPMDDSVLSFQRHSKCKEMPDKQIPVLIVDSHLDGSMTTSTSEQPHTITISHSNNGSTPPCRKRKERKFSGEEPQSGLSLRSSSEERPSAESESPLLLGGECMLRRCSSHEEMRILVDTTSNNNEKVTASRRKLSSDAPRSKEPRSEAQELSPHPPKPKRREIDSDAPEPILDPQGQTHEQHCAPMDASHDLHEDTRTAERMAPRAHQSRNRWGLSRAPFRKSFSADDSSVPEVQQNWDDNQNLESRIFDPSVPMDFRMDSSDIYMSPPNSCTSGDDDQRVSEDDSVVLPEKNYEDSDSVDEGLSNPILELPPMHSSKSMLSSDGRVEERQSSFGDSIPHLDLNTLHEHGDGDGTCTNDSPFSEPIPSEHRFSWPLVKPSHDDVAMLSPSAHYLRKANSYEAPQSRTAYKNYLYHRSSLHLAHLPPSPPLEQSELVKSTMKEDEEVAALMKQLAKKIHNLKKKVKQFEETFEAEHGFRPSHAEKMNYSEVKKLLVELNKSRKELRQLKEEGHGSEVVVPSAGLMPTGARVSFENTRDDKSGPTVEESLTEAVKSLSDKRRHMQRPETVEEMNRDQVLEEKLAIQRVLLRFESIHGRPTSKTDRDLMRPLYDRYRNVKRIIARSNSFNSLGGKSKEMGMELQPILEHVAMDFTSPTHRTFSEDSQESIELPSSDQDQEEPETSAPLEEEEVAEEPNEEKEKNEPGRKSDPDLSKYSNLHELPLWDLQQQQHQARTEKRKLRRALKDFEEEFQKKTGRRVQKEDRAPMETAYVEYKHVKARLKLLEALVTKHEQRRHV